MRRYSIVHPFFLSYFSSSLYRDAARNWGGFSFVYLLLLVALCLIPGTVQFQRATVKFVNNDAPKIIAQLPTITVTKGKVSIDKPSPCFIQDPRTGQAWLAIDTAGEMVSPAAAKVGILLTAHSLIVRKSEAETRIFDLSKIEAFSITPVRVSAWVGYLKWLVLFWYPFAVAFLYLLRIIQVCIYACLGMFFAKIAKADLKYPELLNVAVMAITPTVTLWTALHSMDIFPPHQAWIGLFLSMGFLFYGVKVNRLLAQTSNDLGPA